MSTETENDRSDVIVTATLNTSIHQFEPKDCSTDLKLEAATNFMITVDRTNN
jgi:hypothetical protein